MKVGKSKGLWKRISVLKEYITEVTWEGHRECSGCWTSGRLKVGEDTVSVGFEDTRTGVRTRDATGSQYGERTDLREGGKGSGGL